MSDAVVVPAEPSARVRVLAKFTKQPVEVIDYDFDFSEYLRSVNDVAVSHTAAVTTGLTVETSSLNKGVVKVFVSGGTDGETHKVTATVTTQGGRVKQADIQLKVKEI